MILRIIFSPYVMPFILCSFLSVEPTGQAAVGTPPSAASFLAI
jgi:hypothetical protein